LKEQTEELNELCKPKKGGIVNFNEILFLMRSLSKSDSKRIQW